MILSLYRKLAKIAEQYLIVTSTQIIYFPSGEPQKLRIFIIDGSLLDIYFSMSGKYSYHWERRHINRGIYRFDNAPHKKWVIITSFPKHFHNGDENKVMESQISSYPKIAIREVLDFIDLKLKNEN